MTYDKMPDIIGRPEATKAERDKLEGDLLCWYNFYQKCHEVEKAEPFPDHFLALYKGKAGCITERPITFDQDDYFKTDIEPALLQSFKELHPSYQQKYEAFVEKSKPNNDELDKKAKKRISILFRLILPFNIILPFGVLLGAGVGIGVAIGSPFWGVVLGLALGVGTCALISKIYTNKRNKIKENFDKEKIDISQAKWDSEHILLSNEFIAYSKEKRKQYDTMINKSLSSVYENINTLKAIQAELKQVAPIPDAYSDELHIQRLLVLVHNGRADTLKEAINLMETETYRGNVLGNLQQINQTATLGFTVLSQQNIALHKRLQNIEIDQKAMFVANSLFR